jgi:Uma2 family endonuclease
MSAALLPPPSVTASQPLRYIKFTRTEVDRLMDIGFFEGRRYELIDGDLIDKMGQNPPHALAIRLVLAWLMQVYKPNLIQVQLPIEVAAADRERSLPEPDFSVLAEDKPDFAKRHPRGDETVLVIEVSDTTAAFDLSRKAMLYAVAGVPEYWVLDLSRRLVVVHREPFASGYHLLRLFSESESVSPANRSQTVRVGDLLPAA